MATGFTSQPVATNITDTTVVVSGTVATLTLPVWQTIPDQTDNYDTLPQQLNLNTYVTSDTPITAWGADVGSIVDGILTIPEGTTAGPNSITVTATNQAGQAAAAPFTWTLTYAHLELLHNFDTATDGGFTHTRGSEATMHDYHGTIVTVDGTDSHDEAFVGSQYTDPDTYVDQGVGYGIQLEESRTNYCLHSGDISQAAWVTSNVTVGGTDTITATADNGTLTQTITIASAAYTASFTIERVTGSGTVEISAGNGVWVPITLVGQGRFSATQTAANPVIGVRLGTSGDSVRVKYAQHEAGAFATSHVPTAAAPTTRAATTLSAPFSALSPLPAGGVVNDFCFQYVMRLTADQDDQVGQAPPFTLRMASGSTNRINIFQGFGHGVGVRIRQDGAYLANTSLNQAFTAGEIVDVRCRVPSSGPVTLWVNGTKVTSSITNFTGFTEPLDVARGGDDPANTVSKHTHQSLITRIVPAALTDTEIMNWDSWYHPFPIITQQPQDVSFGEVITPETEFTTHPVNTTVTEPTGATFVAIAINEPEYLWKAETAPGSGIYQNASITFPNGSGFTSEALNTGATTQTAALGVRCEATKGDTVVQSNIATLTVLENVEPPPGEATYLEEAFYPEFKWADPNKQPYDIGGTATCHFDVLCDGEVNYTWTHPFDNDQVTESDAFFTVRNIRLDQNLSEVTCTATSGQFSVTSSKPAILYVIDAVGPPTDIGEVVSLRRGYEDEVRWYHLYTKTNGEDGAPDTNHCGWFTVEGNPPARLEGNVLIWDQGLEPGEYTANVTSHNRHGSAQGTATFEVLDSKQKPTTGKPEIATISAPTGPLTNPLWDGKMNYVGESFFNNSSETTPPGNERMEYGGLCLAVHPTPDHLYVGHAIYTDYVSIWQVIPGQDAVQVNTGIHIPRGWKNHHILAGLEYEGKYYTTRTNWYGQETSDPTVFTWTEGDLSATQAPNYWAFNNPNGRNHRFFSHYMGHIPEEWQPHFGAPCFAGGGQQSGISSCNVGFSFATFDPSEIETAGWGAIDVLAENPFQDEKWIMDYRYFNPIKQDGKQVAYGGFFIPGTRTWAMFSQSAGGVRYYKRGGGGGYDWKPERFTLHCYDVLDLLEVKAGRKLAEDIQPYDVVDVDYSNILVRPDNGRGFQWGATALDIRTGRMYAYADKGKSTGGQRVYMWDLI